MAELLLSALVAPIMMLVQTSAVVQILTGRDSGWNPQARDSDRVPWPLLWRFHRRHMIAGALLAVAAGAISWRLLAWMSPALIGLVLAVPLAAFMGSAAAGRALERRGILLTPEERDPPALAAAADAEAEALRARGRVPDGLPGLLADPRGAGAAPGLARPADVPPAGRARCRPRQRAPEALRRPAARPAGRPRDLRRPRLARDALGARARAGRSPAQMNDL